MQSLKPANADYGRGRRAHKDRMPEICIKHFNASLLTYIANSQVHINKYMHTSKQCVGIGI